MEKNACPKHVRRGEDVIFVYVFEVGDIYSMCLPVDPSTTWAEFKKEIRRIFKRDPDAVRITYFDDPFTPEDSKTLTELGITHKGLLKIQ